MHLRVIADSESTHEIERDLSSSDAKKIMRILSSLLVAEALCYGQWLGENSKCYIEIGKPGISSLRMQLYGALSTVGRQSATQRFLRVKHDMYCHRGRKRAEKRAAPLAIYKQ